MARIEAVNRTRTGPLTRIVLHAVQRGMPKLTGRRPARGSGIEPVEIWAHRPKMMSAMGRFQGAVRKGSAVDERIRTLMELKASQMIGCEYCVDLGSQIGRHAGLTDAELLALPDHRSSELFSPVEMTALDYAVAVTRTPVEVTDELYARMAEHFDDAQLVELTALLMVVGLNRFNAAFGVDSAGFSDGLVCLVPERPAGDTDRRPAVRD